MNNPRNGPAAFQPALSIVVPAYDEEDAIGPVLAELHAVMTSSGIPFEIVVVDDGSQDNTAAAAHCAVDQPGLKSSIVVLQHNANRGYGAAIKTGIRHTRFDVIAITDADGTYPNERLPELVGRLTGGYYDMVVGARIGERVAIPPIRRPAKWAIGKLANLVAGEPIPDLNSGLRVFRRSVVLEFFDLLPEGFSFTTTITLGMLTNGYLVDYVAIDYHARVGRSKIRPIHDTLNFVQLILRIALYFAPLKIFLPLSLLLLVAALAWGIFSTVVLHQLADVSTIVVVMTAIQVAVIGLLAELINRRFPSYTRAGRTTDQSTRLADRNPPDPQEPDTP